MNKQDAEDLQDALDELMERYDFIKNEVRRLDKYQYERWKAGGFLIDDDIISMYPAVTEVVEYVLSEDEDDDEEE